MNLFAPLSNPTSLNEHAYNYAIEGKLDKLKELAQQDNTSEVQKVNWNWQHGPHRLTALFVACAKGHALVVDFLLNLNQIDPNLASLNEVTPFYVACSSSRIKIVEKMLKDNRVDIDKTPINCFSPLLAVAHQGHLDVAKLILNSGRKVNLSQRTTFGNRTAAEEGREMAEREQLPQESKQAYDRSRINGPRIADLLDAFEKDPEAAREIIYFDDAFNLASSGELDKLKELAQSYSASKNKELNWNWQIGPDQLTALHAACQNGHDLVVEYLLSLKLVDPNLRSAKKGTPLRLACKSGKIKVVERLLRHPGIDVNLHTEYGNTPLYAACEQGHHKTVQQLLLDPNIEINLDVKYAGTPLTAACEQGHHKIVQQLLLDPRININASGNGATPLTMACISYIMSCQDHYRYTAPPKKLLKTVHLLLQDPRIEVNCKDDEEGTPLNMTLNNHNNDILGLLLADERVNIHKDEAWFTAVTWGDYDTVELFLASGKDIDPKMKSSKNNFTAAEWARADYSHYSFIETEDEYDECRPDRLKIADLLDEFERDPELTRKKINTSYASKYAPSLFALTVFLSDDFLAFAKQPKLPQEEAENYTRFFKIAKALPMELQMILCHRAYLSIKEIITSEQSAVPFRNLAHNVRPIWFKPLGR